MSEKQSPEIIKLDSERVQKLIAQILEAVRDDMKEGPVSRVRIFEALNALAVCAASVLNATTPPDSDGVDEIAGEFFRQALNVHLRGASDHKEGDAIWFVPGQQSN